MAVTLNLMKLVGNSEETSLHPAYPTIGQVLCFFPKLFGWGDGFIFFLGGGGSGGEGGLGFWRFFDIM